MKQHILEFIQALPASIEEIYLTIDRETLRCDEDEDFDPICDLAPLVFSPSANKPRLHTLDIDARLEDIDGCVGPVPEKGVFYRRLPYDEKEGEGVGGRWEIQKRYLDFEDGLYLSGG